MLITDTWVQIADLGCVLQKQGTNALTLAYSSGTPTDATDTIGVAHNLPQTLPAVTSKVLWAIAKNGDVGMTVGDLAV